VTIDGVPVTGTASPMRIHSGALAGYATLRDTIAPQYQAQLDQMAGALIARFAESDQTGSGKPTIPGLFTAAGVSTLPVSGTTPGLAAAIGIAASVDPAAGGAATLLRDGGIGASDPAYSYNAGGGAGFSARILQLADSLSAQNSFGAAGGIQMSGGLEDYANASVSWLQGARQAASNRADQSGALASQASEALSNATGVNLDAEMTNMLNLENSYRTTAKLLTTVSAMFSALLEAA
jgi:flagellar hook-associated protein 1 FlgK